MDISAVKPGRLRYPSLRFWRDTSTFRVHRQVKCVLSKFIFRENIIG